GSRLEPAYVTSYARDALGAAQKQSPTSSAKLAQAHCWQIHQKIRNELSLSNTDPPRSCRAKSWQLVEGLPVGGPGNWWNAPPVCHHARGCNSKAPSSCATRSAGSGAVPGSRGAIF